MGNSAARDAIASGDYEAIVSVTGNWTNSTHGPRVMTEDQFNQAAERYQEMRQVVDAEQAVKDNGYAAWSDAMNSLLDAKRAQITQDNFDRLVQGYQDR